MPLNFRNLILLLGLCVPPGVGAKSLSEAQLVEYERFFQSVVAEHNFPGAAYAIVSRDAVLDLNTVGYTSLKGRQPVDSQTIFRLASVSKTFAAELAGLLVEEGRLDWQAPVTRYVPEFRVKGDTSRIKLLHILGQSSGIVPYAYDNLLEEGKPVKQILARMAELDYTCPPGSCYGYQNSIFSLVETAIERVSEESYSSLIQRRLFQPLGMRTASLGFEAFVNSPNTAKPHRKRGNGQWYGVGVSRNYYRLPSAAGVNASITDMSKWLQAQLGARPEILPAELLAELYRPRVETRRQTYRKHWRDMLDKAWYGLGWRIYQLGSEQLIYHGGWVAGFRADLAFSPQRNIGIVILVNAEGSGISELNTGFWKRVFEQPVLASDPAPRTATEAGV